MNDTSTGMNLADDATVIGVVIVALTPVADLVAVAVVIKLVSVEILFAVRLIADGVGLVFARNAVVISGVVGEGSGGCGGDVCALFLTVFQWRWSLDLTATA